MNLRCILVLLVLTAPLVRAEKEVSKEPTKDPMATTNWRQWNPDPAPVFSPEESLAKMVVAPGFRVELVAAAPLIKDPVFAEWDMEGRLWVCEFQSYMRDAVGSDENTIYSRVVVLEDLDQDGRMDKSTTFLDKVINPRSLSIVRGGALVASGTEELLFCEDTDGDLVADKRTPLMQFAKGARGNIEHAENGLHYALDNWMYNSKSNRRLRWQNGEIAVSETKSRGQWGISTDRYGRLYHNTNSSWFNTDSEMYDRHLGAPGAPTGEIRAVRVNTALNRAYKPEMIQPDGRIKRVTSISGLAVHSDGAFGPAWQGAIFSFSPGCNLVGAFTPQEPGPAPGKYTHVLYPHEEWDVREFLASSDERFRPVNGSFGPDGCLYVVDFYRGIIQHKKFLTSYLRRQSIERKLDQHIGDGRIWRVVPEDYKPMAKPDSLVSGLDHARLWWRLASQKRIVETAATDLATEIQALLTNASPAGKVHALWTLAGLKQLDAASITRALGDADDFVRLTALRLAGETTTQPHLFPPVFIDAAKAIAETDSTSALGSYAKQLVSNGYPDRFASVYKEKTPKHISKDKQAKKIYETGRTVYGQFCAACHQPNGKGLTQVAPSLVQSDWVTDSADRLIAIALHGLSGPIHVNGKPVTDVPQIMPPHFFLTDEQLANTLSYVRNAWGNKADLITPEAVATQRERHKDRLAPWTEAEIRALTK